MHEQRKVRPTSGAAHNSLKAHGVEKPDSAGNRPAPTSFVPRTELGRRLWRIRQRILASGQSLLDWEGIESELRERRGEASEEA